MTQRTPDRRVSGGTISRKRFEDLLEEFRSRITGTDADFEVIAEAVKSMDELNAASLEDLHAYATCGRCGQHYSLTEWTRLAPCKGLLWELEAHILREFRRCVRCEGVIEYAEAGALKRPPDTQPIAMVANRDTCCDRCKTDILPGDAYVARVLVSNGLPPLRGQRRFCSEGCES